MSKCKVSSRSEVLTLLGVIQMPQVTSTSVFCCPLVVH